MRLTQRVVALQDWGMQHKDDKTVHFGRWIWWKIYITFNGNRARAMQELDRSWQTIRNYSLIATPDAMPALALADLERRLKLPPGSIRETYLSEPMPPIPLDPRGRKATPPTVERIKIALPLDLAAQIRKYAKAKGETLHEAIIAACEAWVSVQKGSGEVILPTARPRFSKRLPQADHKQSAGTTAAARKD